MIIATRKGTRPVSRFRCLTLAVSRRAMDGTRMPQSYHWRGRLHCFVRRGFGADPGPTSCCSPYATN